MNFLYQNRSEGEKNFIKMVCLNILETPIINQIVDNKYGFIFCEGRPEVEINKLEHFAMFHSAKAFSGYNYPIFCFVNNANNFLNNDENLIKLFNIKVIKIKSLISLQEYSDFLIKELFFLLPKEIDNYLTIQADGMLLKSGWETWIESNQFDMIGAHWQHDTSLEIFQNNQYYPLNYPLINMCNMGFSFRKASKMRFLSEFGKNYQFRQRFDINLPEDVYYSYLGFGSEVCKKLTPNQCDIFCKDPLNLERFNKKESFGFHFFITDNYPEKFLKCYHS